MKTSLHRLSPILAAAAMTFQPVALSAQVGSLDPDFATAGKYVQDFGAQDNLTSVRVQPADQKIVAVGTALTAGFAGQLLVVRLMPDGTLDTSFDGDGTVLITAFNESYAYDLFFQPDGKIVVVGARADAGFQFSMLAMRLNTDGSLDTSFGTNGFSEPEISTGDDFAYAVAALQGGQFLLAGTALDNQNRNQPVVVRMNDDGSVDAGFGNNGVASIPVNEIDNKFSSIGVQADGSIVASGHIDQGLTGTGQFDQDVLVARFTPTGTLDPAFGSGGTVVKPISAEYNESALGMTIDASDDILLCGYTTQLDFSFDGFLMKLDAIGNDDAGFGSAGLAIFDNAVQDVFTDLTLQPDGKILVCGTSGGFFFDPRDQLLARYLTAGTLDPTFDPDGFVLNNVMGNFDEANALTLQADGKMVVAGKANSGLNNDITVFRHLNDINTMINERPSPTELVVFPDPVTSGGMIAITSDAAIAPDARVHLFDASGNEIALPAQAVSSAPWRVIELPADLATGLYSLQVITGSGALPTARLVVQD